jgi:hypothetical protein
MPVDAPVMTTDLMSLSLVRGLMKFVVKECLSIGFASFRRGCGQP